LAFYQKRLRAFLANVQDYQCYDIYSADSIRDLIKQRQYYFYSYSGLELIDLEDQMIIELLQNLITFLRTYHNYNIAFITQNAAGGNTFNRDYSCLVKERQAVFLEVFKPSEVKPEVRLSITEPMLVKAFEEYFREIWEGIAPVNKNKQEVIKWLQSQIDLLKK